MISSRMSLIEPCAASPLAVVGQQTMVSSRSPVSPRNARTRAICAPVYERNAAKHSMKRGDPLVRLTEVAHAGTHWGADSGYRVG